MSLVLQCPTCSKTFSSIMLYDLHVEKNSKEQFLKIFNSIMSGVIAETNRTELQVIIDSFIVPEMEEINQKKKKTSQKEKRKNPQLTNHKLIKKKSLID